MTRSPLVPALLALAVLALAGCTPAPPGGDFAPTAGPAVGDEGASPDVESSARAEEYAPPSEWTEEELVGVCKADGDILATGRSWEDFSSDPTFEETTDGWSVSFPSLAEGTPLQCEVSGTPEDPTVTLS